MASLTLAQSSGKRWRVLHLVMSEERYLDRLSDGYLFYSLSDEPLLSFDEVKAAKKRDGEVVSR